MNHYLGIEIGGTKLQLGVGADDGVLAALWRGAAEIGPLQIVHPAIKSEPFVRILEGWASGWSMARNAELVLVCGKGRNAETPVDVTFKSGGPVTAQTIAEAAGAGDPTAQD